VNSVCPSGREFRNRALRRLALVAACSACASLPGCGNPEQTATPVAIPVPAAVNAAGSAPPPVPPHEPVDRKPEPRAIKARADAIRRTKEEILAECQNAAAGDWGRWQRETASYRAALKTKVERLKTIEPLRSADMEAKYEVLEGKDDFPLFEVAPREYLHFLYDQDSLNAFRKDRPVVAAHRWLRDRGIDLIFVPVPKMTEIYIESFVDPCPADGIIAPHVRRTLLELLNEDVEVVDAFPLYRSLKDADSEYLYNSADSHWAPRAMRILAKELADRIERYKFGASARFGMPITKSTPGPYSINGIYGDAGSAMQNGWLALNPHQQELAEAAEPVLHPHTTLPDGQLLPEDPHSPVMIIGHSYVANFREDLIREINLLINTRARAGQTTEAFKDFLREPELINSCKVVVWITTEQHMPIFKALPPGIAPSSSSENPPRLPKR
jgi:hypothetical protein